MLLKTVARDPGRIQCIFSVDSVSGGDVQHRRIFASWFGVDCMR